MKVVLADLPNGAIVRMKGGYGSGKRWGVLCSSGLRQRPGYLVVDFWDGGREWVRESKIVEVPVDVRA